MVPIGYSPFPEISYGFSLGGSYKNFDFSVLFQGEMCIRDSVSISPNHQTKMHASLKYRFDVATVSYTHLHHG